MFNEVQHRMVEYNSEEEGRAKTRNLYGNARANFQALQWNDNCDVSHDWNVVRHILNVSQNHYFARQKQEWTGTTQSWQK